MDFVHQMDCGDLMEERRRNDAVMASHIGQLTQTVAELSTNVRLQTQALESHKEVTLIHIRAMEKEHEALKKTVFNNISEVGILETNINKRFAKEDERTKRLESRMDKAEGMGKMASIGWTVCTALLGGLVWLLTKVGILS